MADKMGPFRRGMSWRDNGSNCDDVSSTESTTLCEALLMHNSNSISSHSSDEMIGAFRYDRRNTMDSFWTKRRITKTNNGSLPNESVLNDKENWYKIDGSLRCDWDYESKVRINNKYVTSNEERDQNDFCHSYNGDLDQKKLSGLARDIFANSSSNRYNNAENVPSKPISAQNNDYRRESDAKYNLMAGLKTEFKRGYQRASDLVSNNKVLEIKGTLGCSLFFPDSIWTHDIWKKFPNIPDQLTRIPDRLTEILLINQNIAKKVDSSYTWSGQLPKRNRNKNPIYSCKVFLGGIPYDLTDTDLHIDFARFGAIQIQWPGVNVRSAIEGAAANKAGYVYVIFESYDNVTALLNACTVSYKDLDSGCRWYFNMNSRRTKMKEVQVIPFDIGDRFYMKGSFSGQMDHSKTVFVGALHGMLSADGLAKVMDDLFGGVIFAGLDTDKHKYPLGSGRVSFDNNDSFMKAVEAAFVEIKSSRFKKKIQIDPYIENESVCYTCKVSQQSPVFCRDMTCFQYYCRSCWDAKHSEPDSRNHRPIIKNKPN